MYISPVKKMSLQSLGLICILFPFNACHQEQKSNLPETDTKIFKRYEDAHNALPSWSKNNSLIIHMVSEPDNLHPTNGNSNPRSEILYYTQRSLMYVDFATMEITPGLLVKMPDVSSDGLRYDYVLRDNITWDDGQPLTAQDMKFTAKAFKCPLTRDHAVRLYWDNVDSIYTDSENPYRFSIIMKRKQFQNISFLTSFVILQRTFHDQRNILANYSMKMFDDTNFHAVEFSDLRNWANEFNDDKYGRESEFLNGLGMYKVKEWASGQYITLERKKNHWTQKSSDYREVSFPEKIIFKINKDEASQLLEFRSQVMDVTSSIPAGVFIKLYEDEEVKKNYNMVMLPTYNYTYICFNEKPETAKRKNLFTDVRVRRALAMLTPVDALINIVYKDFSGNCHRMTGFVSPLKQEFNSELKPIAHNPSEAARLLAEAGWSDTDEDGILNKTIDGKLVKLEADLNYLSSSAEWKNMALLVMEAYAKAGIKINPVAMDLKLWIERARSHNFDLMLGSWGGTGLHEDYSQLFNTSAWENNGSNYPGFGSPETNALLDSMRTTLDEKQRFALSRKLQKLVYDDQPYIYLYSSMRRIIIHKRFGNQVVFSERPGYLGNMFRLLSINKGITMTSEVSP